MATGLRRAFALAAVCAVEVKAEVEALDLPLDDACTADDASCSLSLRQLRGELSAREVPKETSSAAFDAEAVAAVAEALGASTEDVSAEVAADVLAEVAAHIAIGIVAEATSTTTAEAFHSYVGCYKDDSHDRRLPVQMAEQGATIQSCRHACSDFTYFGLQYFGECFCGNGPDLGERTSEPECNTPCTSKRSQTCGGVHRNSVYRQVAEGASTVHATRKGNATSDAAIEAMGGNACIGQSGWDDDFASRAYRCAVKTMGNAWRSGRCMASKQHVSRECGACMGQLIHCGTNCVRQCCDGHCTNAPKCVKCGNRYCRQGFIACAGVDTPKH